MGLLSGLSSGAGSLLGGVGGALISSAFSYRNAEQNRSLQRSMSNTAFQRSMADMRKAGLNPILGAAKGASPASTPGGAPATFENPITSAMSAMRIASEIKNIEAQTEFVKNKTDISEAPAQVFGTIGEYLKGAATDAKSSARPIYESLKNVFKPIPRQVNSAKGAIQRKVDQVGHTYSTWWQKLSEEAKGIYNSAKSLFSRGK